MVAVRESCPMAVKRMPSRFRIFSSADLAFNSSIVWSRNQIIVFFRFLPSSAMLTGREAFVNHVCAFTGQRGKKGMRGMSADDSIISHYSAEGRGRRLLEAALR